MSDGGLREKELIKQFLIIVRESGFSIFFEAVNGTEPRFFSPR